VNPQRRPINTPPAHPQHRGHQVAVLVAVLANPQVNPAITDTFPCFYKRPRSLQTEVLPANATGLIKVGGRPTAAVSSVFTEHQLDGARVQHDLPCSCMLVGPHRYVLILYFHQPVASFKPLQAVA
jgi:hypothetical protein